MKQHPVIQALGKVCNTCKYFDVVEGYCDVKEGYCVKKEKHIQWRHHDESCEKWKIASDLKQSRRHTKKPKVERVNLLAVNPLNENRPTSQDLEEFFNDA